MEPLRLGVIGLGPFGKIMAFNIQSGKEGKGIVRIEAVCDLQTDQALRLGAELECTVHPTLDDLLADPKVEAIALFTEPLKRAALLRRIIRAGKDVMTTKPFEADVDEAISVLQEAALLNRMIHLNSPSAEPTEDIAQILCWIDEHKLGRPVACRMEMTCSYREKPDGGWYDDPLRCPSAPLYRLGIYCLNDMTRFLGEPEKVQLLESRLFTTRPTPDQSQVSILFKNGSIGNIFCSFCVNDDNTYANRMTLNFENGTVYRNSGPRDGNKEFNHSRMQLQIPRPTLDQPIFTHESRFENGSGSYQWDLFVSCVRGLRPRVHTKPELVAPALQIIKEIKKYTENSR